MVMAAGPEVEEEESSEGEEAGADGDGVEAGRIRPERPQDQENRQNEIEGHGGTHVFYRNWCPHCVNATWTTGQTWTRRGCPANTVSITVSCGSGARHGHDDGDGDTGEGGTGKFPTDRVLAYAVECGDQTVGVRIKTDQEIAIKLLVKDLCQYAATAAVA